MYTPSYAQTDDSQSVFLRRANEEPLFPSLPPLKSTYFVAICFTFLIEVCLLPTPASKHWVSYLIRTNLRAAQSRTGNTDASLRLTTALLLAWDSPKLAYDSYCLAPQGQS
jgi:hypothetical protein